MGVHRCVQTRMRPHIWSDVRERQRPRTVTERACAPEARGKVRHSGSGPALGAGARSRRAGVHGKPGVRGRQGVRSS